MITFLQRCVTPGHIRYSSIAPCQRYLSSTSVTNTQTTDHSKSATDTTGNVQITDNVQTIGVTNIQTTGTSDKSKTVFWIPKSKGGLIVGKKGSTLTKIRNTVNAENIYVGKNKSSSIPILVYGTEKACTAAVDTISQILLNSDALQKAGKASEIEMWVPVDKIATVIGKGGQHLRQIELRTGTSILIDNQTVQYTAHTEESEGQGSALASIKGTEEGCAAAKELIQQLITSTVKVEVWIPETECGFIIGKKVSRLATLQTQTNTGILIDRTRQSGQSVPVEISGTAEDCAMAKDTIEQLICTRTGLQLMVPQSACGIIIGKKGATKDQIMIDTGANIVVYTDTKNSKNGTIAVQIRGTYEQCAAARRAIELLVTNVSEEVVWVPETKLRFVSSNKLDLGAAVYFDWKGSKEGCAPVTIKGTSEECLHAREAIAQLTVDIVEVQVAVPENKKRFIVGKGGAKISEIEQSTGTIIETKTKDGSVTIMGTEAQCSAAKGVIEGLVSRAEQHDKEHQAKMWIPESRCGGVIGKRGATITEIEQSTNTDITINVSQAVEGSVPVMMKGSDEGCRAAIAAIEALLTDKVLKEIWIPELKCGVLLGKGGVKLSKLKKSSGAHISIDSARVDISLTAGESVPVTIEGTPEAVSAATATIEQLISDTTDIEFMIPREEAAMAFSLKGGRKVKEIEERTGAHIIIEFDSVKAPASVPVTMRGTEIECAQARKTLEHIITNITTVEMLVPEEKTRLIHGVGGTRIGKIEQETGTHVQVDWKSVTDGKVPVTINGNDEECAQAKEIIERLIDDSSVVQLWVPAGKCGSIIGHKGERISKVREDTGAVVTVDMDVLRLGRHSERCHAVNIMGTDEECSAAKEAIEDLIAKSGDIERVEYMSESSCMLLLGVGMNHIAEIQHKTHTGIYVDLDNPKDGTLPIKLQGTAEACEAAVSALETLIANYSQSELIFWIPAAQAPTVIGQSGQKVAKFERETGTFIKIDESLAEQGLVPIQIRGRAEDCSKARAAIELLCQDVNFNHDQLDINKYI